MVARGRDVGGVEKLCKGSQKVQTLRCKIKSLGAVMSSMGMMVHNAVLCTWKLLREEILKVYITRKKNVAIWHDGY